MWIINSESCPVITVPGTSTGYMFLGLLVLPFCLDGITGSACVLCDTEMRNHRETVIPQIGCVLDYRELQTGVSEIHICTMHKYICTERLECLFILQQKDIIANEMYFTVCLVSEVLPKLRLKRRKSHVRCRRLDLAKQKFLCFELVYLAYHLQN
ncbi:unnamed protein product [Vicia faba]|uniref:Uncharacterized protein n=1 Tax=Vicia faba TaxID=3906 RepID=A0AAV0ZQB7_VICFA|nr:unnamed protein product [Vicia faba]